MLCHGVLFDICCVFGTWQWGLSSRLSCLSPWWFLRALRGDSVAKKEMMEFVAMQHSTILERVAEFLGTDMRVSVCIGNSLFSCNAGIECLQEALFDIHVRFWHQVWSGFPWHEELLVAHCNAAYFCVLSCKSTWNSWEDGFCTSANGLGFVLDSFRGVSCVLHYAMVVEDTRGVIVACVGHTVSLVSLAVIRWGVGSIAIFCWVVLIPILCFACWFSVSVDCLSLTSCLRIITCKYNSQTLLHADGPGADVGNSGCNSCCIG